MIRSEERRKICDSRAMRPANCKQRLDFRDVSLWRIISTSSAAAAKSKRSSQCGRILCKRIRCCDSRATSSLFDHLVGARNQSRRHRDIQRLSRLVVDHQLIFGRCLNWKFRGLGAFEDAICPPPSPGRSIVAVWLRKLEGADVCFGSKADIRDWKIDVRFTPKSGHESGHSSCPLCANSGLTG
jgi:hypothetical protein